LYQNDILDVGTCALAVAGTAVTGAMRIASDNHWASDVIVGHLMGYASGYLLPTVLCGVAADYERIARRVGSRNVLRRGAQLLH
jgi:hypothetical protein